MNTFVNSTTNQPTTTTNGMAAFSSTSNYVLDLFGKIGSSRNLDIVPLFTKAYAQDRELALRTVLYSRDIREGLGERNSFIQVLKYLEKVDVEEAKLIANKAIIFGRYKDLLYFETTEMQKYAADTFYKAVVVDKNLLAAKWLPSEKGANKHMAKYFMKEWNMTPKQYRKLKSSINNVVETKLCSQNYDDIVFEHVPSIASNMYKNTFLKHCEVRYKEYLESVTKGEKTVNVVNCTPNQILKEFFMGKTDKDTIMSTSVLWNALPDLTNGKKILPIVDTSGSMSTNIGGNTTAYEMSVALGLYLADKNKGEFNGAFVSFASVPKISKLSGSIYDKFLQVCLNLTCGSTNLEKTFNDILEMAKYNNVSVEDMPEYLLILSDMQFNSACSGYHDTAIQMIDRQYADCGYTRPKIIFWNLVGSYDNTPVKFDTHATAFVSGYSQNILNSVLSNIEDYTPENVMMNTIMNDRYKLS